MSVVLKMNCLATVANNIGVVAVTHFQIILKLRYKEIELVDEEFLGTNWLLDTPEGVRLYHDVAVPFREKVGIVDVHTHHNLRQIVENKSFPNIWRVEVLEERKEYANCDHYIIQLAAKSPYFSQALARGRAEVQSMIDGNQSISLECSGEKACDIISAIAIGRDSTFMMNLPNRGQITNLPSEVIVETAALANADYLPQFRL